MKRFAVRLLAMMMALVLFVQLSDAGIAYAIDKVDEAVNPAERIPLTVPESLEGGKL